MNSDYIFLPVETIENQGDLYIVHLGQDQLTIKVKSGTTFYDKYKTMVPVELLEPGQGVYIKLFDSSGGINPIPPTRKEIEKLFFSRKKFQRLPNFVLNN